jgi:hypothetical protein
MKLIIASSFFQNPLFVVIGILAIFGLVAIGTFFLSKVIPNLRKKDEIDDETAAREEIERLIVKIDDQKIIENMEKTNDQSETKSTE